MTLAKGWAESLGAQLREIGQTEAERCRGTEMRPRKAWRGHEDVNHQSRLRGARSPTKRPLPPLFREDDADAKDE